MAQITAIVENKDLENDLSNISSSDINQTAKSSKTKFREECERGITVVQARQHTHEFIKQL